MVKEKGARPPVNAAIGNGSIISIHTGHIRFGKPESRIGIGSGNNNIINFKRTVADDVFYNNRISSGCKTGDEAGRGEIRS